MLYHHQLFIVEGSFIPPVSNSQKSSRRELLNIESSVLLNPIKLEEISLKEYVSIVKESLFGAVYSFFVLPDSIRPNLDPNKYNPSDNIIFFVDTMSAKSSFPTSKSMLQLSLFAVIVSTSSYCFNVCLMVSDLNGVLSIVLECIIRLDFHSESTLQYHCHFDNWSFSAFRLCRSKCVNCEKGFVFRSKF